MSRNYKNIWKLNSKLVNKSDYIDDYNAFSDYMNDVPDNHGPPPLLNFKYDITYADLDNNYVIYNWTSENTYINEQLQIQKIRTANEGTTVQPLE